MATQQSQEAVRGQGRGRHRRHAGTRRGRRASPRRARAPPGSSSSAGTPAAARRSRPRSTEAGTRPATSRPISARSRTCRKVMAEADKAFGRVDVLVNVAALTERGTILNTSPELFDRMFAINVRAPFFLMQDAAKIMRREKIAGRDRQHPVDVRPRRPALHLGLFRRRRGRSPRSPGTSPSRSCPTISASTASISAGWTRPASTSFRCATTPTMPSGCKGAEKNQPFGRLLKPTEVARAVAYLASDESGMMTGSIIDFDQQVLGSNDSAVHPRGRLADA